MGISPHRRSELEMLRRVRDRIDREFAEPLDIATLARTEHVSAGHLARRFVAAYGEPPYSYLMTRRIERAMTRLRQDGANVTDVCYAVGFSSLGTFSTRFRELVGISPSEYRARAAGDSGGQLPPCLLRRADRPVRNREVRPSSAP